MYFNREVAHLVQNHTEFINQMVIRLQEKDAIIKKLETHIEELRAELRFSHFGKPALPAPSPDSPTVDSIPLEPAVEFSLGHGGWMSTLNQCIEDIKEGRVNEDGIPVTAQEIAGPPED